MAKRRSKKTTAADFTVDFTTGLTNKEKEASYESDEAPVAHDGSTEHPHDVAIRWLGSPREDTGTSLSIALRGKGAVMVLQNGRFRCITVYLSQKQLSILKEAASLL